MTTRKRTMTVAEVSSICKPLSIRQLEDELTRRKNASIGGCTCDGHLHSGGAGGCYFGGLLVPACDCTARLE